MRLSGFLYLGGMAALLLGERLVGGEGLPRWLLSGSGLLLILASLLIVVRARAAAPAEKRRPHDIALTSALFGVGSLAVYALGSDMVVNALAFDDEGEHRFEVVVSALWPIVWLAGTLAFLSVDRVIAASPVQVPTGRAREAALGGLSVALAVAFLFPLNYLGAETNERWDLGYFKTARPSESTKAIIDNLEEPMRAVLFFPTSSDVTDEIRTYFNELGAGSNLSVEYVDHALEPELSKELKVRDNGYIALVRGDQVERVKIGKDFDSAKRTLKKLDGEIQKTLLKMVRDEQVIYMTVGHGELYWKSGDAKDQTLNTIKSALKDKNLKVKELGAAQGLGVEVPEDAAMVMVLGPTDPFLPEELSALEAYVDRGGRLLMGLEPGGSDLDGLLARLGIQYVDGGVLADDQFYLRVTNGIIDRLDIVTNKFSTHESVTTLSRNSRQAAVAMPGAGALETTPDAETGDRKVRVTMRTLPSTWMDLDGDLQFDDGDEKRQTWSLAIASNGPAPDAVAEDGGDPPEYRAVVVSDATWASDTFVPYSGNGLILFDSLAWLLEDPSAAGEESNEEDVKIQHTREGQGWWFYGTAFLIPAGFFGLGMVRLRARKHRGAR